MKSLIIRRITLALIVLCATVALGTITQPDSNESNESEELKELVRLSIEHGVRTGYLCVNQQYDEDYCVIYAIEAVESVR